MRRPERRAGSVIELLAPVRERGGLVVELGCGSGLLTRHLLDAGHRVVATDASPAMLELARDLVPGDRSSVPQGAAFAVSSLKKIMSRSRGEWPIAVSSAAASLRCCVPWFTTWASICQ
jgi:SAM-dependent methyltransferase